MAVANLPGPVPTKCLNERVRVCALEAPECLVRFGRVERAVVVLYFRELFNGKLERTRSDLWDCLAGLAVELEAAELLPEIRRAYSSGFPQVNIVRQICLINGTFPGNGTLFRQRSASTH